MTWHARAIMNSVRLAGMRVASRQTTLPKDLKRIVKGSDVVQALNCLRLTMVTISIISFVNVSII